MSTPTSTEARSLRIGEVAERTGTTVRTIRYYEEIGLLPSGESRPKGKHRVYTEADVERLLELRRLRDLLGLSLDELKVLIEAEDARAALRRQWHETEAPRERRRILEEAQQHVATQLELVRNRKRELTRLEDELVAKQRQLRSRRRELG
jgi:DNA-binding transcriptional MerR regulator